MKSTADSFQTPFKDDGRMARRYSSLFEQTDEHFEGQFRVTFNAGSSPLRFAPDSQIVLLFILEGSVDITFRFKRCTITDGNFAAISVTEVADSTCAPGTVAFYYDPSCRLSYYLLQCKKAFNKSFSNLIPMSQEVFSWADSLIRKLAENAGIDEQEVLQRKKEFSAYMMNYPVGLLGELYVAFFACSTRCNGDCQMVLSKE